MIHEWTGVMGLKAIGAKLPALTRKVLGKRGDAFAAIVADWAQISGVEVARATLPESLGRTSGILTLRVDGAIALEVQHLAPQLVERINQWLGRPAVSRIRLARGVVPRPKVPPPRPEPRQLSPAEEARIERLTEGIDNAELAAALRRLGRSVAAKS